MLTRFTPRRCGAERFRDQSPPELRDVAVSGNRRSFNQEKPIEQPARILLR